MIMFSEMLQKGVYSSRYTYISIINLNDVVFISVIRLGWCIIKSKQ